jgi:hypothetical protein
MQESGLEWAWRLWLEPRRLFWRYLTTNPRALSAIQEEPDLKHRRNAARLKRDPEKWVHGFSLRQTQSVCPEIMLKQKDRAG